MSEALVSNLLYVLVYGIIFASLYGIMTVGFSFICGLGGFYDIALPVYFMVAAFLYVRLGETLHGWAIPVVLVATGAICLLHYLLFVKRIRSDPFTVFFTTIILALLIESFMAHYFSAGYTFRIETFIPGSYDFLGVSVRRELIVGGVIGWLAIFGLRYLTGHTNLGRAIIAIPQSAKGSQVIGLDITRIQGIVYFIGGVLLAVGAYFYGSYLGVSVSMWIFPLIIMFTITVVGGLGSINGIILATIMIGLLEVAVVVFIDPRLRAFVILGVAIIVLIFKPKGFAGIRVG